MNLVNSQPRYSIAIRKRVASMLDGGCVCGGEEAVLVRRLVGVSVTIHLQCKTCGKSVGGALPRSEFYFWQDYPEWDSELPETYWKSNAGKIDESQFQTALEQRRSDYAEWLANSHEWAAIRSKVMERAGGICEACLTVRASQVHHTTYIFGKLPPAWELRAVCHKCHERLHSRWDSE